MQVQTVIYLSKYKYRVWYTKVLVHVLECDVLLSLKTSTTPGTEWDILEQVSTSTGTESDIIEQMHV